MGGCLKYLNLILSITKIVYSSFMIMSHLAVFPKASQYWKVAHDLMSSFDVIFFNYGVAKPVVSYSKVKIFGCCLQNMMPHIRQALFGAQFAD